jgi:DNA-binding GntR family transcriptional regulator
VSRGDEIAAAIRSSIISGKVGPGDRLPEDRIAEQFGVSRVPVREAIRRLDVEGYVTVTLNAGARVAAPSGQDAKELLQIRTSLEVLAARLAAERRGGGRLDELAKVLSAGEAAVRRKRYSMLPELSAEFHGVLIEASGNDHLVRMLAEVRAKLAWIWAIDVETRAHTSWAAHKEVFAAISQADPDRAAEAIASHLRLDELALDPHDQTSC